MKIVAVPLALGGGGLVFIAVLLVILVGVVWGYYTRRGSDITLTPSDGSKGAAPGAAGPDRIAGKVEGEQDPLDTRGTG